MRIITFQLLLALLLLLIQSCNQKGSGDIDVDVEIMKEMDKVGIPSVVACVVDTEGIRWTAAYGWANEENSIPATDKTIYALESISKLFLSITVFQLWEQGLIDLQEDINTYLPFWVRNPYYPDSVITPYMLLNHISGLAWPADDEAIPDFHHFYILDEDPPLIRDWLPEYILPGGESYRSYVWKKFPPGTKQLYSNIGTSLLALIVEEISGMDYRDYCRSYIFDPLQMDYTSFYFSELDYELLATPYYKKNSPMWYFTCRYYPIGFINTNLVDFAIFVQACLNYGEWNGARILKESSFKKMLVVQNPQTGEANLWVHYIGGALGHIGGGTGFATSVEWQHDEGRAFFILSNLYRDSVYPKGRIYEVVKYQCWALGE